MDLKCRVVHVSERKVRPAGGTPGGEPVLVRDLVLSADQEDPGNIASFGEVPTVSITMLGLRHEKFKGLGGGSPVTVKIPE